MHVQIFVILEMTNMDISWKWTDFYQGTNGLVHGCGSLYIFPIDDLGMTGWHDLGMFFRETPICSGGLKQPVFATGKHLQGRFGLHKVAT